MTSHTFLADKITNKEFTSIPDALYAVWEAFREDKINCEEGDSLLCLVHQCYPRAETEC